MAKVRKGTRTKIRVFPSGRRVKVHYIGDRVVGTEKMARIKKTRLRSSLLRRKRRIGLR